MGETTNSDLVSGLSPVSAGPRLTKYSRKGCGQGHVTRLHANN